MTVRQSGVALLRRCSLLGLLLLVLLEGLRLGYDVCEELEVFYASDCVCWLTVRIAVPDNIETEGY